MLKRLLVLVVVFAAYGQTTGTVVFNVAAVATATPLACTITANAKPATQMKLACTNSGANLPVQFLDVSVAGESVTYSLSLGGHAITAIFTQSSPAATVAAQVTADGGTAAGTF